jgi:hypothetical protein
MPKIRQTAASAGYVIKSADHRNICTEAFLVLRPSGTADQRLQITGYNGTESSANSRHLLNGDQSAGRQARLPE